MPTINAGCSSKSACDLRINNNCYVHIDEAVSWNEAEACCVAWGGHLASIHSNAVNYHLNSIRNKDRFTWIGLKHTVSDGSYKWTDGTDYDYENIAHGIPDGAGGDACLHYNDYHRGKLTWNDYHCTRKSWKSIKTSYICQRSKFNKLSIWFVCY